MDQDKYLNSIFFRIHLLNLVSMSHNIHMSSSCEFLFHFVNLVRYTVGKVQRRAAMYFVDLYSSVATGGTANDASLLSRMHTRD